MKHPERLEDLLIKELVSIPTYLWGGFFAIHVSLWRYLIEIRPEFFGIVDAYKRSRVPQFPFSLHIVGDQYVLTRFVAASRENSGGYVFKGPPAERLNEILWGDDVIMDIVERLAYFLSDNTNRGKFVSGQISKNDLPVINKIMLRQLAEELLRVIGQ